MQATKLRGLVAVTALATVLLAGTAVVSAKVSEPAAQASIVLYSADNSVGQAFKLRNKDGDKLGLSVTKDQLTDGAGHTVGRHDWQCLSSSLAWYCSGVISLRDNVPTGKGTITVAGLFDGFNGESLAITGGTGAYAGARGTVLLSVKNGQFARTVKLMP